MRKVFLVLSIAISSFFFIWVLLQSHNQFKFVNYTGYDILRAEGTVNRESLTEELNQLAKKTNSQIARRIVEPNKEGKTSFVYEVYGEGDLPKELNRATEETAKQSDLLGSYIITKGKLTPLELQRKFNELGYRGFPSARGSALGRLLALFLNKDVLVTFFIFMLTFAALTIISRIKDLRVAGIRLISGESFWSVMTRSFKADLLFIGLLTGLALIIGSAILIVLGQGQANSLSFFSLDVFLVNFAYLAISLILSAIYLFSLKKDSIMAIIKGKMPVRSLIVIMLIGQFSAIVLTGWTSTQALGYIKDYQIQAKASQEWSKNDDLFSLSLGLGDIGGKGGETEKRQKALFQTANEMVKNHDAMLIRNNLKRFGISDNADGLNKKDYAPGANTIYVTPNYLDREGIEVDESIKARLKNLKKGEFGLLLPKKLKGQEQEIVKRYTDRMQGYGKESVDADSKQLFDMKPITGYLEDNKERFLYNVKEGIAEQYLVDPIIVVMTPESTGDTPTSILYWWVAVPTSMLYKGYDQTVENFKKLGIYPLVSYIYNGNLKYQANTSEIRNRLIILLAGAVLSLVTAALLFSTMNLLYFEEFRREIFIKRMAGMASVKIHELYLLGQATTLVVATCAVMFISKNIVLTIGTFLVFSLIASLILFVQMTQENRLAASVLKGK